MARILTLGAGKVGRLIAAELSKKHLVSTLDQNLENLASLSAINPKIKTLNLNVTNLPQDLFSNFDLIVSAVPGFLGYKTLESIINSKKHVVDISFMPENHLELRPLAEQNLITAIPDAGLAPGLTNLFAGYFAKSMEADAVHLYVGGLPVLRKWPFEYKAPFSFLDVMEEYTRTARVKFFNQILEKEPLSEVELIESSIGTLEAFNTDGVRSMLTNLPEVPTILEKTMRYPGYAEYINVLKSSGFFSKNQVTYKGVQITPYEFTCLVLDSDFRMTQEDEDVVVFKAVGFKGKKKVEYEMIDFYNKSDKFSAMARTTGYVASACVSRILESKVGKGMFCLEDLGKNEEIFNFFLDYLKERGVVIKKS